MIGHIEWNTWFSRMLWPQEILFPYYYLNPFKCLVADRFKDVLLQPIRQVSFPIIPEIVCILQDWFHHSTFLFIFLIRLYRMHDDVLHERKSVCMHVSMVPMYVMCMYISLICMCVCYVGLWLVCMYAIHVGIWYVCVHLLIAMYICAYVCVYVLQVSGLYVCMPYM